MGPGVFNTSRVEAVDENAGNFQNFQQGMEIPVKNRKQTDPIFFVVLVLLYLFLVISISIAGSQGDIRRLFNGYDDKGNVCGYENEPIIGINGSGLNLTEEKFLEIRENCYKDVCRIVKKCVRFDCWYCPTHLYNNRLSQLHSFVKKISLDLSFYWMEILALCFFSICLCGLTLTVLRMYPSIIICTVFFIVSIAVIGGTIYIWTMVIMLGIESRNSEGKYNQGEMRTWVIIGFAVTIFAVAFFVMLHSVKKKYKVILILFVEGGKCIRDMPTLLLQPVLTYLINGVFVCFLFVGLACFITSGKAELDANKSVSFPVGIYFQITSWVLLFAFLWLCLFLQDFQNLVIAGAVSSWCFSKVKESCSNRVCKSFSMVLKYHLGSAAFGSLLIAIVRAIRFIINMAENKQNRNGFILVIATIVKCLLLCVESLLQILNKSAYVLIVLFGEPFCISARKAFGCITKDAANAGIVIGIGTFILTIVELLITFIVSFVGLAIFKKMDVDANYWVPTIIVFLLSCMCCHCFFSVYDMTIDTLIICFCVDQQMDSGLENPLNMSMGTMGLLNGGNMNTNEVPYDREGNRNNIQVIA